MTPLWESLGENDRERDDIVRIWTHAFYNYVFADAELLAPFRGLLARSRPQTLVESGRNPLIVAPPWPPDPGLTRDELEDHVAVTVMAVLGRPGVEAYDLSGHLDMNLKPAWFFGAHRWFLQSGDDVGVRLGVLKAASGVWFDVATQIIRRWADREAGRHVV